MQSLGSQSRPIFHQNFMRHLGLADTILGVVDQQSGLVRVTSYEQLLAVKVRFGSGPLQCCQEDFFKIRQFLRLFSPKSPRFK